MRRPFGLLGAARSALLSAVLLAVAGAGAQTAVLPADAVDAFHAALKRRDTAGALSLLDRAAVVFELGVMDGSAEAYALSHLAQDMDLAVATRWTLQSRRIGGEGNERWILSSYKVEGRQANGAPLDHVVLETAIVRRQAGGFRIAHLHWSTDKAGQAVRSAAAASGPAR